MDPRRHHRLDQTGHRRAGLLRPAHQPLGRPLRIRPMCLRHVLGLRRVRSATKAAQMARHALALREAFHRLGAHPDIELLAHQLVGHAVVVAVDLDVVVDVDPRLLPLRVSEALPGQRSQSRPLETLEERPARAWQLAEGPVVQRDEKLPDRLVDLGEREKLPVPQPSQDPSLHELHARLDLGFVSGLAHPRRHHRHAVVHRQVLVGRVELRLVPTGSGDAAAKIVRDHQLGETAAEFERPNVRADPVGKPLAPRRLREGVAARTPHRHEDLRLPKFPGPGVHDRHRRAAVVHEQLLAGPVHLAHAQVQLPSPSPVQLAETAVLVAVRLPFPVLLPDQAQRHALELQLLMHLHPVHCRSLAPRRSPRRRIEPSLELLATPALPPRVQHASPLRPLQVLRDARPPDTAHPTGLPLAQTAHQKQPQHLLNFPHAESPCRHLPPFVVEDEDATASEPNSSLVPTGRRPPFRSMLATLPTTTHKWPPSRPERWPPSRRNPWPASPGIHNLALVLDDHASMAVWKPTLAEFYRLLVRHGAFRDVRQWHLVLKEERIRLARRSGVVVETTELFEPSGRRIVLLISDCVADIWYRAEVWQGVAEWARRMPVALVQTLPGRLWSQTGLGEVAHSVRSANPGAANAMLEVQRPWWDEAEGPILPLPVITLEPHAMMAWANLVVGSSGTGVPAVMVPRESSTEPVHTDIGGPDVDAKERIRRYRESASTLAFRLATYLSGVPLSLPVMRLVQYAMLPDSSQVHLAEFLLGGLIEVSDETPMNAAPEIGRASCRERV